MKRYIFSLFSILCLTLTLGFASAQAGLAYIGPLNILQLNSMGVTFGGQTAGNIEIKITPGLLPAGLGCTDTQYLTVIASDVTQSEFGLLIMARANSTPIYLWISDDPTHTAVSGRCSFYSVNF